jgi:hypothetical protein
MIDYDAHEYIERITGSSHHDQKNIYKFRYLQSYSNDDVAIYQKNDTYIVAFRGTDYEPLRYLGYLPREYQEQFLISKQQYPLESMRPAYECIQDEEPDYFGAIAETSKRFCDFTPLTVRVHQNCIQENRDFDKWDFQSGGQLVGGQEHCSVVSDCRANKFIAKATTVSNSNKNLDTEPKHIHAFSTLRKLFLEKRPKKLVITGHSLGGSLAMYATQQLLSYAPFHAENARNPIRIQTIIFNSAPTLYTIRMPDYFLPNILHVRNHNDVVSFKRDNSFETWNFKNYRDQNPWYLVGSAQRQFHGLDQFFCKGVEAPHLMNKASFRFMSL